MLILASQSPRRSEILRQAGFSFVVRPANVDETVRDSEAPEDYVKRVARDKACAIEPGRDDIVLGADTTVVIDGRILAKPMDRADAVRMLQLLSGREHVVLTGICLRDAGHSIVDVAETRVRFHPLSTGEIEQYAETGEPMDKAGAYAIQGGAAKFVARIEGSYANVVGLPIEMVCTYLQHWAER